MFFFKSNGKFGPGISQEEHLAEGLHFIIAPMGFRIPNDCCIATVKSTSNHNIAQITGWDKWKKNK